MDRAERRMVKTRSGLETSSGTGSAAAGKIRSKIRSVVKRKKESGKKAKTENGEAQWRYPPCPQKGRQHGRCAVCVRAGFTRKGYEEYFYANPRKALPRPPQRLQAPRLPRHNVKS